MQQLQKTFEGNDIRIVERSGQTWFVAVDVCKALGLSNATRAVEPLDEDETTLITIQGTYRSREVNAINESGVRRLIAKSRKPQAESLGKWLGMEVLHTHVPCLEATIIARLKTVFAHHRMSTQKQLGAYRADLFFPDFNLVVEVDEDGHRNRNQAYEAQRDAFMQGSGYTVIRYDPDSEPIEALFASIHEHIFNYQ